MFRDRSLRWVVMVPFVIVLNLIPIFSPVPLASSETGIATTSGLSCPAGTRQENKSCVLDGDLRLDTTLNLSSFTKLNCRGYHLLPASTGTGTSPGTYVPSVPPVAIAITGDLGVDVRNCAIGEDGQRFDFGILAIQSKNPGRYGHRIHDNQIHARDTGIVFLRVDDARISNNVINWTNGSGISFLRDSDRNRVNDNVLSSPGAPPAATRLVPGGPFRNGVDDAIFVGNFHLLPLFNVVIENHLYQFPNSQDGTCTAHEDIVIENNYISLPGSSQGKSHTGTMVATNSMRTQIKGNVITNGATGVRLAGLPKDQAVLRAARCIDAEGQQTSRFCEADADCFIPEIDTAPIGYCPELTTDICDLRGRNTLVEDNTFVGPFNSSQSATRAAISGGNGTVDGVIRHNQIYGAGIESGIILAGNMLETGIVTENAVHGAASALTLLQGAATVFGAQVFLNDFTGSTVRAISVSDAYLLPTELSWQGIGNYWGHETSPCFLPSDTPLPILEDNYPFCVSVAGW